MSETGQNQAALAREARAFVQSKNFGVLATHSREVAGYPFGSVTPYCLDAQGMPCIYISTLAQHTRNILENPKVSLTILELGQGDVQAEGRVSILADAEALEGAAVKERYYRFLPGARRYESMHDFGFYRLVPRRIRFIGGFGRIRWVEAGDFLCLNPFGGEAENRILKHMNEDHPQALRQYLKGAAKTEPAPNSRVEMVGLDGEGFDLLSDGTHFRIFFPEPVATAEEARKALVAMAR